MNYPVQLEFHAEHRVTRWRPLVQWLLATPHLMIAWALRFFRQVLTLISFVTVLFTEEIPRPLFDAIAMTHRCEWRAMSYAPFMHEDYPPFDFKCSEPATSAKRASASGTASAKRASAKRASASATVWTSLAAPAPTACDLHGNDRDNQEKGN